MTLEELNSVLQGAAEAVEEKYQGTLARRYEAAMRTAGAVMEREFKARALTAAATFLPPDEDDVVPGSRAGETTAATRRRAARTMGPAT